MVEFNPIQAIKTTNFKCGKCGNGNFIECGEARVVYLKGNSKRYFSFELSGIMCVKCGKVYISDDELL